MLFQSTSVLIVFLLQLGLRAGGRMHFHLGEKRVVEKAMGYLNHYTYTYIVMGALVSPLLHKDVFFAFCSVQAIMSFNQGIFIAKGEHKKAARTSLLIFLNIALSGGFILALENSYLERFGVEALSLFILLYQNRALEIAKSGSLKCTYLLIKKYFPLQIASLLIYFGNFVFAQLVIRIGKGNQEFLLSYADANIVCGIILLLVGKAMVVVEGEVIEKGRQDRLAFKYVVAFSLIAVLYSGFATLFLNHKFVYSFVFCIAILGRFVFAFCSQFSSELGRRYFFAIGGGGICMLIGNIYFVKALSTTTWIIFFSSNLLAAFLFLILNQLKHNLLFLKR